MNHKLKYIALAAAMLPALAAGADGFLPLGGATATSHYAIETLTAGYTANAEAVLSHGSLPAVSTYTSGIGNVAADNELNVEVTLAADGLSVTVAGLDGAASYRLVGIDGRVLLAGSLDGDSTIDLAQLAPGHYLLQITSSAGSRVHHILKSR